MEPTTEQILRGLTAYPIPEDTLTSIAIQRGLNLDETASTVINSTAFNLAKADMYKWLSTAPNISQGGQSYSFTTDEREIFRVSANSIYKAFGEPCEVVGSVTYGYKGSRL